MLKKIALLLLSCVIALSVLASCDLSMLGNLQGNNGNNNDNGGNNENNENKNEEENVDLDNLIYNADSELVVVMGDNVDGANINKLTDAIFTASYNLAKVAPSGSEPSEHEIIIGNTDRVLTNTAMMRMNRDVEMKTNEDELFYCIYSDGSSIAIVFEEDYDNVTETRAINHFIDTYVKGDTLTAKSGLVELCSYDIIEDYYEILDNERMEEYWGLAEEKVGKETVRALQSLTSLYDFSLISWIANLYDPCICVCVGMGEESCSNSRYCRAQGGGFYFSNSARDTAGYLPDLESTRQALDMLNMSGMTWLYGGNYYSGALPADMIQAIGRYTQVLQSEDGYFRHPQWASIADFDMRLNRDLSWATTLLNAAKLSPFYTTPTGIAGIGVPPEYTSGMTSKLDGSAVSAVSKVVTVNASYPEILESIESFREELDSLTAQLKVSSYGTGSRFSTYLAQINARDKVLGTPENPKPLMTMLYEWYEENKNPERGTWVGDESYGGNPAQIGAYAETNGVMKIIGCYSNIKLPYTYGLEAMRACIDVLTTDENPSGTVDIYNAWIALNGVYSAVINYNPKDEADAARELMNEFRLNATDAVIASRDKIALFKRADGSFSYSQTGGSGYSMGMPTQVKGTSEGDVNGALIASADCWGHICSSLGFTKVPFFGAVEMYKFRKIVMDASPVKKQGVSMDYTFIDFEDDEQDEETSYDVSLVNNSTSTSALVRYDSATNNKYLEFVSTPVTSSASGNSIKVNCASLSASATAYVFEGDLCLKETSNSGANFQIQIGDINYFILAKVEGGKVKLIEASSDVATYAIETDFGVDINVGDWFRLKVIYYVGDKDTVRVKVYFDNLADGEDDLKLLAVSDNYWDQYGNKLAGNGKPANKFTGTRIYALKNFNGTILVDNVAAYKTKDTYTPETDINNQPPFNVDPPESPEKIYDFEDETIDEDITVDGDPTVADGKLRLNSQTSLTLPIVHRALGAKCASISFDINCASANVGDLLYVTTSEPIGKIFGLALVVKSDSDGKYITLEERSESVGKIISAVRIPLNETANLRVDYHHNEDVALIYLNDKFVAASSHVYKDAAKRTIRTLEVKTAGTNFDFTIDNLIFERNATSYEEATQPKKNSVLYTFEDGLSDATISGSAKREFRNMGGNQTNVIELGTSIGALTVPVNHRADISTILKFKADLYFGAANNNGETHLIKVKDIDGVVIFALALKVNGNDVEIYEVGADGTASKAITQTAKAGLISLSFDLYQNEKTAFIYLDSKCVGATSIFCAPDSYDSRPMFVEIATSKTKSTIYVDNVKAETLYQIYEAVTVKGDTNKDGTNPLDFDKSSTGSLPSNIIKSARTFRVENVFNSLSGKYSNVGVLATVRGVNEKIGVTLDKANTQSCVTFETDLMISGPEYSAITQIFFTDSNNEPSKGSAYGMVFQKSGDGFSISDYTSGGTKTTLVSGLALDTWYRLRVEYYILENGEARIMVYINDTLKYVTANHYNVGGSAKIDVKSVMFYTFLDSKCNIYVDNMSLTTSNATCSESVGAK